MLYRAGLVSVMAAKLEPSDVAEDIAAHDVATAAAGDGILAAKAFTGRCNLYAKTAGVLTLTPKRVDRLNLVHEAITIATLPCFQAVKAGQMVATVKLIPFAAPAAAVAACCAIAGDGGGLLQVAAFQAHQAGLVMTRLPETKASVLDKTRQVTERRLAALGSRLAAVVECAHDVSEVTAAIKRYAALGFRPILVLGASAVVDRGDVIPEALRRAGGTIDFFGMPVDPGNLLMLGRIDDVPVIGLPGCARSPKLNGLDFVLRRILAGFSVTRQDVACLGVGGLLDEVVDQAEASESDEFSPSQHSIGGRS
jgi:molybdenum cofactor cytidylyltransferase